MTDANVRLWGRRIGAVSWDDDRAVGVFQYDAAFINAGINAALNILALGTRAIGRGRGDCIGNLSDPSRRYRMVVNYSI